MTDCMRAGQHGEESKKKGQRGPGVSGLSRSREARCALMMTLCERNQAQPCPFFLCTTDRGLMWAGQLGWVVVGVN